MSMRPIDRRLLARHLVGRGVELGPGHHPFPLLSHGVCCQSVDRWAPDENKALFPELEDPQFPQADIVADLDQDRLSMIRDESQDFVIASHVLEHLANPLAMLREIWRVLKPRGVTVILLPDRRRTFDRHRNPTPLSHLVGELTADVRHVSDAHVEEFLEKTGSPLPDGLEWHEHFELHRRRSIHVHCWTDEEFLEVVAHSCADLGAPWNLVDGFPTEDGEEFGFVLSKVGSDCEGSEMRERVTESWHMLSEGSDRTADRSRGRIHDLLRRVGRR